MGALRKLRVQPAEVAVKNTHCMGCQHLLHAKYEGQRLEVLCAGYQPRVLSEFRDGNGRWVTAGRCLTDRRFADEYGSQFVGEDVIPEKIPIDFKHKT